MAKIYWLLNTPGFPLEHLQWVDIGHGIYLGNGIAVTTADSVVDDQTMLEFTLWVRANPVKLFQIGAGEIIDLSVVGIDAALWPVAARISGAGRVSRMMLGISLKKDGGGNHGISTESI